MKIESGETILRTVSCDDIELIRQWRNSLEVKRYLKDQTPISYSQQLLWFKSIMKSPAAFFLIEESGSVAGMAYATKICFKEMSFEGNIFIGNSEFIETIVPVKAAVILSYFFFNCLRFKLSYSIVHCQNKKALALDKFLGFEQFSLKDSFIESRSTSEVFNTKLKLLIDKWIVSNGGLKVFYDHRDNENMALSLILKSIQENRFSLNFICIE